MIDYSCKIQISKGDRHYIFFCDSDSPLGEVYDALWQMKKIVTDKMKAIDESSQNREDQPQSDQNP